MEYLMKKPLLLLLFSLTTGYGQQFNGCAVDSMTGRIQVIQGYVNDVDVVEVKQSPDCSMAERRRQSSQEIDDSIRDMQRWSEASSQYWELRKQTDLLEKIANK